MLSANKPLMQQNFSSMISENGLFYKAAYDAFYETMKPENISDPNLDANSINNITNEIDKKAKDAAKKFAKAFVKGLKDGGFDSKLATEIDNHVKAIQLLITMMPQGLATIISPVGPCTGSMVISDATASIQLL